MTVATAALPCEAMGTRRWFGELESWLRRSGSSRDELVKRSNTSAATVRSLFEHPEPNPTLRVYLELLEKAGARFNGVIKNDPVEIIKRLKEIMARENVATLSALAKVADVNRSQLSRMFNASDPNPTLEVFDRLVVALGAERDFVLVSIIDEVVAQAIVVGSMKAQVTPQEAARHLHAVPDPAAATTVEEWERRLAAARAQGAAAEARERDAQAKMDAVLARAVELHQRIIDLEQKRADDAAEYVRVTGANATLERLRAEDAAEIARLTQAKRHLERLHAEDLAEIARLKAAGYWSLRTKILFGLGCAVAGASAARLVMHARR